MSKKKSYIAVNTIVSHDAKGNTVSVAAGEAFVPENAAQRDELLGQGAIREIEDADGDGVDDQAQAAAGAQTKTAATK